MTYNARRRLQGPLAGLDPEGVGEALMMSAFGAFLLVRQAARRGRGAILLDGAAPSIKGFAGSASFAMGKFALCGLAQGAARELGSKGIQLAHFSIDGGVRAARRPDPPERPDSTLNPDAIAQAYLAVPCQRRSAWSFEVERRPWLETL